MPSPSHQQRQNVAASTAVSAVSATDVGGAGGAESVGGAPKKRSRLTAAARREQLLAVARSVFARRGLTGASIEEIAATAEVSRPVVYEHFGSKQQLYQQVVAEEMARLEQLITNSVQLGRSRERVEKAVWALLTYVEENPEAFIILSRTGDLAADDALTFSSLLGRATDSVAPLLSQALARSGFPRDYAHLYANAMVGAVAQTAQWWLEQDSATEQDQAVHQAPEKSVVVAHLVNLLWNGVSALQPNPHDPESP